MQGVKSWDDVRRYYRRCSEVTLSVSPVRKSILVPVLKGSSRLLQGRLLVFDRISVARCGLSASVLKSVTTTAEETIMSSFVSQWLDVVILVTFEQVVP